MQFTKKLWACAILALMLVAGCGGGNDAPNASDTTSASGSGGSGGAAGPAGCTDLTFINTGNNAPAGTSPHANGDKLCFLASETQLQFGSKTLTAPTRGNDIPPSGTVLYRQYAFADGGVKYNVIFQGAAGTTIYEINVNNANNSVFYGNFE
jgi:hypothetical protein